ncbi:MAG: hypothetical protein M1827_001996 [Pycnora praestabilis]|nr:MAG: hypothetical protein M1827_001996 [Pycnora praestabilis]
MSLEALLDRTAPLPKPQNLRRKPSNGTTPEKDIKLECQPLHDIEHIFLAPTGAKRPLSLQPIFDPSQLTCSTARKGTSITQRPRHIPIQIPAYDIDCAGISCLDKTIISDCARRPSLPILPLQGKRYVADLAERKPRHVPIVIPAFAHPFGLLPEIPPHPENATSIPPISPKFSNRATIINMSRPPTTASRTSTIDSTVSAPSPSQMYSGHFKPSSSTYLAEMNSSQSSLTREINQDSNNEKNGSTHASRIVELEAKSAGPSPAGAQNTPSIGVGTPSTSTTNLSGLVCNVHRTTGKEPYPLVGATTTILGDKLYVFGGRILSRRRPQLTADLYELDLINRHWTKLETKGDTPPPRYFHSMCYLGDTKLVCYGGMSPVAQPQSQTPGTSGQQSSPQDPQPEVVVMSDIHIYDVPTRTWMYVNTTDTPQGRYAHCATILPSSATFSSANAPLSAIHHNPASSNPNQGSIGVSLDGNGGAEMVVVGGQDAANHYIEQISVFNLRSLKWTVTSTLDRSCGAYRSVVAPLSDLPASRIGKGSGRKGSSHDLALDGKDSSDRGSSMLIYSNYNFLDVKLELQVRSADGILTEKPMHGNFSPPGLRFPNGGIIDNHFVVSGTYLTSSKQEYALWALDLKLLTWSRIDAGGGVFSQGSWNRGVLWNRRNTFVILGNRKRSLVEDYNHRRINFSNICMVELEAFGLYDNPRRTSPLSGFQSGSSPDSAIASQLGKAGWAGGGRPHSNAAKELGQMALSLRELADMDLLAIGGERVPVNSRLIARRWGPYFIQLLREGVTAQDGTERATLRPNPLSHPSRNSSVTITPTIRTAQSTATTLTNNSNNSANQSFNLEPPDPSSLKPTTRPRTLYLPHTHLTLQTLVHYLYTNSLPQPHSPLCTPQILCSLLQLARPYQIDGLLEATVERLHQVLDGRNAAAVFNAAAMAAGGGRGVGFGGGWNLDTLNEISVTDMATQAEGDGSLTATASALRINTRMANGRDHHDEVSSASTNTASDTGSVTDEGRLERDIWNGEISAVVGLQKRGLRGLMEGRRMRERGRSQGAQGSLGGE